MHRLQRSNTKCFGKLWHLSKITTIIKHHKWHRKRGSRVINHSFISVRTSFLFYFVLVRCIQLVHCQIIKRFRECQTPCYLRIPNIDFEKKRVGALQQLQNAKWFRPYPSGTQKPLPRLLFLYIVEIDLVLHAWNIWHWALSNHQSVNQSIGSSIYTDIYYDLNTRHSIVTRVVHRFKRDNRKTQFTYEMTMRRKTK